MANYMELPETTGASQTRGHGPSYYNTIFLFLSKFNCYMQINILSANLFYLCQDLRKLSSLVFLSSFSAFKVRQVKH